MEKLLTIAIPTYKRTEELKRALEALASQYDERVEILICDDASPDNTQEIIEEFQKKIPIRYIRNTENLGFDRNFIKCYREADGKFVLMIGNDDFIIQGGLAHILSYLEEHNDVDWVFVNFTSFSGECSYMDTNQKAVRAEVIDKANISKYEFVNYADSAITALTSIVCRECILKIENWEKYIGSYFVHTCLWLEATKSDDSVLGIIGKTCIAHNLGLDPGENPSMCFGAFYRGYRYVFCDIAPSYGYDKKQMNTLFAKKAGGGRCYLLLMNANKVKEWRKTFWEIGYPAIKDIFALYFKIIPLIFLPSFIASLLVKLLPVYRRVKEAKRQVKLRREVRKQ